MEYRDFLFIGANALDKNTQIDFLEYLEWLMKNNFIILEEELKSRLEIKKLPKRNNEQIIEGIISVSNKEFTKKKQDKNFYVCHALCILYVMKRIFTKDFYDTLKIAASDKKTNFLINEYEQILKWILLDVEDLSSLYSQTIQGNMKYCSNIRTRYIHTASVHQVLRQGLYGNISFHSFTDKEISATIGTIRQLIELRIRRSFGAMAFVDDDENVYPLDLSMLFEVIRKYKNDIEFPIKLENIIRIYRWSNSFIHSGLGDYSWIPFFLEFMLRNFSFGEKKDYGWNVNNGIITSQLTIDAIQNDLIQKRNADSDTNDIKYKLLICKPECEIKKQFSKDSTQD